MHFAYTQCKQKGFIGVVILIVVLVLAGLSGAYYFGKSQALKSQPQSSAVTSQTQQMVSTPSANTDETIGWKIYTNQKLGYQIKYPPLLRLYERDFGGDYIIVVLTDMELEKGAVFPLSKYTLVSSTFTQAGGEPEIYSGFALDIRNPKFLGSTYKEAKDVSGIFSKSTFQNGGYEGVRLNALKTNEVKKEQYSITVSFEGSKKDYYKLSDQILATFKFL